MGFRELELKTAYDSNDDDVLHDFYIPVLSLAKRYRRLSGFFSSTTLAIAAKGIAQFIANEGEMDLVVGTSLSKQDVDAINSGTIEPDRVIAESMIRELESIEGEFIRDHVRALAWMVAKRKLRIKVAIPLDENGTPLDMEASERRGIFHQKVGVLMDENNDMISFSGSINETAHGWTQHIEEFKVFRSWIADQSSYLESDLSKIRKYWEGHPKNVAITDVPSAVRDHLITMAPGGMAELKLERYSKKTIVLRDYQKRAADSWMAQGRGFIEMATGTGKTYVAISAIGLLRKREPKLLVIITVPFIHLVTQWARELETWGFSSIQAHGNLNIWKDDLTNNILDLNRGHSKLVIAVTTHDTFSDPRFAEIVSQARTPMMLVADEVHGLGAEQGRLGLKEEYQYRMGLSATPRRWLDDEGTAALENYFGNTVFVYSLADAIRAGYLVPYKYYPHFVDMTQEELARYEEISRKLAKQYAASQLDQERSRLLELLAIQRQAIVVDAENKLSEFVKIIDSLGQTEYTLVYCSPHQIERTQDILNRKQIIQHKFTAQESKSERDQILLDFADGKYKALVAMRCLDEGVDVPPTRLAIFLASSGNPKQFIQRRGRILRPFSGKREATIHDVIVVPSSDVQMDNDLFEMERKILRRELARVHEFAKTSSNQTETVNAIYPILRRYRLSLTEVFPT